MEEAKCDWFLYWINEPKRLHTISIPNWNELCFKESLLWGIRMDYINNVRETNHLQFARLELASVETDPLVNYISATLCEVIEIIKGCFVFIIIHSCARNGLMCGQKEHIFLLLGWRADDSWSQDKVILLVPIEFGSLDFTVLHFIYIKWNAFTYLLSFYQCISHVFCSKLMSQA